MNTYTILFTILASLYLMMPVARAGTKCPPRSEIYPCTCANVIPRKNSIVTIVTCQGLADSDALEDIVNALRAIEIDQFYLYDSFWKAHLLGAEEKKGFPADWLTLTKIKEIEVIDTTLSQCFACNWNLNCRNSLTTKFKISNSSSTEKVCTLCENVRGNKNPWTGCMSKLKEFHFNFGKVNSLGIDLFPQAMRELTVLNMSYNQIVKVDPNTFRNLPALITVDLSHNAIEVFDHMFGITEMKLQFLDVSWNFIKTIGGDLFTNLPALKILKGDNNMITELKKNDWKSLPQTLRVIDLSNNPIHCDCGVKWVNSSFDAGMAFWATCATPPEYESSPVRRVSRFLTQRCDAAGNLGTRKPTQKPPSRGRSG